MRHRKSGRKLGRNASHRSALFNNLVTSLLTHGRIETTEAKAKELRSFADATITLSIDVQSLVAKGDKASKAERAKIVHARRLARQTVTTREALDRLFTELGPHFATRKGGYTRVLKTRVRKGDAAPMAFVELVGLGGAAAAKAATPSAE
jgi:large subunit ribosomal protein L17